MVKNLPVSKGDQEDPLEQEMPTHSSILAWKFHGQRRLVGCSPWGHKESDMNAHAHMRTKRKGKKKKLSLPTERVHHVHEIQGQGPREEILWL